MCRSYKKCVRGDKRSVGGYRGCVMGYRGCVTGHMGCVTVAKKKASPYLIVSVCLVVVVTPFSQTLSRQNSKV